jgi:hypothetical protein
MQALTVAQERVSAEPLFKQEQAFARWLSEA